MAQNTSVAFEEEQNILDFASWLHYHHLVTFDCFALFLYIRTSFSD